MRKVYRKVGGTQEGGQLIIPTETHFMVMEYSTQRNLIYLLVINAFLFWQAGSATGIVLHPDGEPNLVTWTDRPHDNVVGRWGHYACCVPISSNCIITNRHVGGGINIPVEIDGCTYNIAEIWDHNSADLRLVKLYGANLENFVGIYQSTDEVGKHFVIAGYGDIRGQLLQEQDITYGYQWDDSGNGTLRFGTNRILLTVNDSNIEGLISDIIVADFDGLGEGFSTYYECIAADHDSGCGWFIKVGNAWEVVGLTRAVEVHYEQGHEGDPNYAIYEQAWFRDSNDPNLLDPDYFDAVRLSSYTQWLNDTIPEVLPGDLNGDDYVDFSDFAVFAQYWLSYDCKAPNWCLRADFEPDGDVDWADLAEFTNYWLQAIPPPP